MNYIRILFIAILFTVLFCPAVWAQSDYFKQFVDPIENQLDQSLNSSHTLEKIYEINEFVGTNKVSTYPLDDPYGTLNGYVLFAARNGEANWIFGLYKNGTVVWHTPEALKCSDINVYGSMDLNLDDRVDIMVNCALFGRNNFLGYMYIFSWNGSEAELISHLTEDQSAGRLNTIVSYEASSYGILDLNGDGIMELNGLDVDNPEQWSYWSWNGSTYGSWPSTPSPPSGGFYPADMAEGDVEVQVAKTDTGFTYQYTVISSPSSKRRIANIYVEHGKPEKVGNPPLGWRFNGAGLSKYPISWKYDGDNTKFMIVPGDSLSGFELHSNTPPRAYNSYIRSEHKLPDYDTSYSIEEYLNDIRTNSHKGITLAPGPELTGFNNNQLTDSLYNFVARSCGNGWAGDAAFCSELSENIDAVANNLSGEKPSEAAADLTEFINNVEEVNNGQGPAGASLTSEGYALLYYNANYLLDRLPPPPQEPGSGIACTSENAVTQSSGTITIQGGQTRSLSQDFTGSVFFESGGVLNVCSAATFQNVYGNAPGAINISESGQVTIGNWNNNFAEDAITNWGALQFTGWTTVNNGSLTNHGQLTVSGGLNQNNGPVVNHGALSVSNAVNLNQPGNINTGTWTAAGTLTLNSNAELQNACRVEADGALMVNGTFNGAPGSYTSAGQQVTVNSGGVINMGGGDAMLSADQGMLNGAINVSGERNLLLLTNQLQHNAGASVTASGGPLKVCSTNVDSLPGNFEITNGCQAVIPVAPCNPQGFNTTGN